MKNLRHHYGLRKDPFPQNIPVKDLYQLPSLSPLKNEFSLQLSRRRSVSSQEMSGRGNPRQSDM